MTQQQVPPNEHEEHASVRTKYGQPARYVARGEHERAFQALRDHLHPRRFLRRRDVHPEGPGEVDRDVASRAGKPSSESSPPARSSERVSWLGNGASGATAKAMTSSTIAVVKVAEMRRGLHEESALSDWFQSHLLTRNNQIEADLVDRAVQLLRKAARPHTTTVGTLRHARRSALCPADNFPEPPCRDDRHDTVQGRRPDEQNLRKLGFLERHSERNGGLYVHRSMLNVLLRD